MKRTEYIDARRNALAAMSTEDLAITICEYFNSHATMPGQKDLKNAAEKIVANVAENPDFEIDAETKESMVTTFSEIAVREIKIKGLQVQNITKKNAEDFSVLKPTDLNLELIETIPAQDKKPGMTVYETSARIENGKVLVGEYEVGNLGDGFVTNNPNVSCDATLVATDYSNGKFSNVSYAVIADIAA